MLKLISLAIVGLSIVISSFLTKQETSLNQQAQELPQLVCEKLELDRDEVTVGETVNFTATTNSYTLLRYGKVEDKTKRAFESLEPYSLGLGEVGYLERTFTPQEPGFYAFEVNVYDNSNCDYLCSAGQILYKNQGSPENPEDICIERELFDPIGECESHDCIKWLTVKDAEGVLPLECPIATSANCLANNNVEIKWNSVPDGDLYQLQRNGNTIKQFWGFNYTDNQVSCNTQYTYNVNAFSDTRSDAICQQNLQVTCPCPTVTPLPTQVPTVVPTQTPTATLVPVQPTRQVSPSPGIVSTPTSVPTTVPTAVPTRTPSPTLPLEPTPTTRKPALQLITATPPPSCRNLQLSSNSLLRGQQLDVFFQAYPPNSLRVYHFNDQGVAYPPGHQPWLILAQNYQDSVSISVNFSPDPYQIAVSVFNQDCSLVCSANGQLYAVNNCNFSGMSPDRNVGSCQNDCHANFTIIPPSPSPIPTSTPTPTLIPTPTMTLPPEVDYRRFDTGVRNQTGTSTCWIYAGLALVEAAYKKQSGRDIDLSEEWFCGCNPPAMSGCNGGKVEYLLRTIDYTRRNTAGYKGAVKESCVPNGNCGNADQFGRISCAPCSGWKQEQWYVDINGLPVTFSTTAATGNSWKVYARSIEQLKRALVTHGSIVGYLFGKGSFLNFAHNILLVGYSNTNCGGSESGISECWIFKNSWGTSGSSRYGGIWFEQGGYGYLPINYIGGVQGNPANRISLDYYLLPGINELVVYSPASEQ
jgi:hypothetical protein